jgi:hypothetical protein
MKNEQNNVSIYLDKRTKDIIERYAKNHSLSRSSVIKLIVNDFFMKLERSNEK